MSRYFNLSIENERYFSLIINGFYETNTWLAEISVLFSVDAPMNIKIHESIDAEIEIPIKIVGILTEG